MSDTKRTDAAAMRAVQAVNQAVGCSQAIESELTVEEMAEIIAAEYAPVVEALNLALAAIVNPQAFDINQVQANIRAALRAESGRRYSE